MTPEEIIEGMVDKGWSPDLIKLVVRVAQRTNEQALVSSISATESERSLNYIGALNFTKQIQGHFDESAEALNSLYTQLEGACKKEGVKPNDAMRVVNQLHQLVMNTTSASAPAPEN